MSAAVRWVPICWRDSSRAPAAPCASLNAMLPMHGLGSFALGAGAKAHSRGEFNKALRYWRFASRAGLRQADLQIGELYEKGRGVHSSPVDAVHWYRRAAQRNHVEAQFRLGRLLIQGGKNYSIHKWMNSAAKQHQAFSDSVTAALFPRGLELAVDAQQAVEWLTKAAEGGHIVASAML